MSRRILAAAFAAIVLALPAAAQSPPPAEPAPPPAAAAPEPGPGAGPGPGPGPGAKGPRGGGLAVCRTDVATHCADAQKGRGRNGRMACLREHVDKLTPECQAVVRERQQHARARFEACKADRQSLCGDARGREAVGQCLETNREKLSAACREALAGRSGPGATGPVVPR